MDSLNPYTSLQQLLADVRDSEAVGYTARLLAAVSGRTIADMRSIITDLHDVAQALEAEYLRLIAELRAMDTVVATSSEVIDALQLLTSVERRLRIADARGGMPWT